MSMNYFDKSKIKKEIYTGEDYSEDIQSEKDSNYDDINLSTANINKEAFIDNLTEEEDVDIGFDLNLLKRNELHVNLIHFDLEMKNEENYEYYNNFKIDVVGGFLAMDDLKIFKKYLKAIKDKKIPFIVISSGTSAKDVIPICKEYKFVKEVIIFCLNYEYNGHYLKEYKGYVKKVFTDIKEVYQYIKTFEYNEGINEFKKSDHFIFSEKDIKMNKQLEQCPVISAYEYDKCYFLIHRAYAHFFGNMNDKDSKAIFKESYFKKVKKYIEELNIIDESNKKDLIRQFEDLKEKKNFVELAIRSYTNESNFCYLFNRTMRQFDSGLISLAYYMGPFLFGVNKYVKDNPENFAFNKDMELYRNIQCSELDFYLYEINKKHIICFPSITSTSKKRRNFTPTEDQKKINNKGIKDEDLLKVTMIFKYKHEKGNISPGIIVCNNRGKDGKILSQFENEEEVILFPFTFVRIIDIDKKKKNVYEMKLEIINRKSYIEYTLRDNVEQRKMFSKLE